MPQIRANGIHLEYESFGNDTAPPIILIMGLGAQLILWPDEFCQALAAAGYRVIRFDNRDVGLSARMDHGPRGSLLHTAVRAALRLPVTVPYTLHDMAQDTVGLMDALSLRDAHVVGLSMGGMIGQIVAAHHAERVRSFTCIMSTSGNPRLPGPSLNLRLRLLKGPKQRDRESLIRFSMETWRLIGSPKFAPDEQVLRGKVERSHDRGYNPAGLARQTAAIIASGSRVPLLKRITAPTLVIHGEDDPLVPVAAANDLARHIPGARVEVIAGMGHDLPPALLPRITQLVLAHVQRADGRVPQRGAA